jgi:predicted kinase
MRIVVLAGPPCSGKTTLARTVAQPGDVVLDYDDIARALGSPVEWNHPEPWRTRAEHAMQARMRAASADWRPGTAWVIRTAPRPRQRERLAGQYRAIVYLLNPGEQECRRRAADRPSGTARSIGQWYHRYRPWSGDRDPAGLDPRWVNVRSERGVVIVDPASV